MPKSVKVRDLTGKVAIVSGGSRGIGREVCLSLARAGATVVVAAKSVKPKPNLPGSIHTVAAEVKALGAPALAVQVDLRSDEAIQRLVDTVIKEYGRIDILINNASALWWQDIKDTPMKKYDLITSINSRGTFCLTKLCLPHMAKNKWGRVICMSPPIRLDGFAGHTAYNISKFGMTMVALGVAAEYKEQGVTGNTLWPATVIESYASINFKLGAPAMWRKANIIADATMSIISEGDDFTGNMLIDDTYLRASQGFQDQDFVQYRCDPDVEPPRVLDMEMDDEQHRTMAKRGDVRKLDSDIDASAHGQALDPRAKL